MSEIFGYQVATDPATLTAFIASARQAYQALEDAIKPVDAKIEELKKDWEPRPAHFWYPVLKDDIPAIREAAAASIHLFTRERSNTEAPAPIIMSAASISYKFDLHHVEANIEEAGIVITAFIYSADPNVSVEQQIRKRQYLKKKVEALSKAVHEAVDKGRAKLDEAPEEQAKLLAPRKRRASAQEPRPLHVVDAQEQAEQEGGAGDA